MENNMKKINHIGYNVYHVISEPGDATRYDYLVFVYFDYFHFMPCGNTFRYPQRLNYYDALSLTDEEINKLSDKENCNVFTLKECIRTMKELYNA
jgi:hypothetical protein